jgi:hypothetical protein
MRIEMTAEEEALLKGILFDTSASDFHVVGLENGEKVTALMRSLLVRQAIPEERWRYFTDPELNPRHRKSRRQIFIDNGCTGDAILTHPHFLKYLRYFVSGPQLPTGVIARFKELATGPFWELEPLLAFVRACVRERRVQRDDAAEEFYKLALECAVALREAEFVRTDAMNAVSAARRSGRPIR